MSDEEWVKAAAADDSLVVELLIRLHHSSPPLPPPPPPAPSPPALHWSVRQPRSKSVTLKPGTTRASPTTPLSWSGATSHSGGAASASAAVDCSEESSRPASGSKLQVPATAEATPTKRSRKKKTMTELKEEEVSLLKERKDLKRTLATLLVTLEKNRAKNESLKKIKMDLSAQLSTERVTSFVSEEQNPDHSTQKGLVSDLVISAASITRDNSATVPVPSLPNRCLDVQNEATGHANKFVIPDLNVALEGSSA